MIENLGATASCFVLEYDSSAVRIQDPMEMDLTHEFWSCSGTLKPWITELEFNSVKI